MPGVVLRETKPPGPRKGKGKKLAFVGLSLALFGGATQSASAAERGKDAEGGIGGKGRERPFSFSPDPFKLLPVEEFPPFPPFSYSVFLSFV